jgi:hypothetical protein
MALPWKDWKLVTISSHPGLWYSRLAEDRLMLSDFSSKLHPKPEARRYFLGLLGWYVNPEDEVA